MRQQLVRLLDRSGYRDHLARARDRVVDVLQGSGSEMVRRNRADDRNLRLLLSFCLHADSNCLEVGANRGKFLSHIQRVAPRGHHIAYEPVPNQYERLVRLFPEMEIRRRALSDANGTSRFVRVLDPGAQGYSRLEGDLSGRPPAGVRTETIEIRTDRFDDHVPEGWLPHFVKIDVEGAELKVLQGAIETFRRARPIIAFESGSNLAESDEVYRLLHEEVGLRLFDMDGHGPLDRAEFQVAAVTRWNWVAHL